MVCHESYKDKLGNWLYPDEIEKIDDKRAQKKLIKPLLRLDHQSRCLSPKKIQLILKS